MRVQGVKTQNHTMAFSLMIAIIIFVCSVNAYSQDVVISEFQAINDDTLLDEDGDPSDWIEVQNRAGTAVNLDGWILTDSRIEDKWIFPDVTLEPGEFLTLFASGKNRAEPESQLHTNFQLNGSGEYLALIRPDGSISDEYSPAYPRQFEDVSFGLVEDTNSTVLITDLDFIRLLVPVDDAAENAWTQVEFDDSLWARERNGVGYDLGGGGLGENIAPAGQASQTSDYHSSFSADRANDGAFGNFTATASADNSPVWELDLIDSHSMGLIKVHNRGDGCCQSRLRDIIVYVLDASRNVVFESELLNPENELDGPSVLLVDLVELHGAPVMGQFVQVERLPDPDLSGTGGQGNNDERNVLSLGEVEVIESSSAFSGVIQTDVEDEMEGENASIYLRYSFSIDDPSQIENLLLRMKFDDGFVAFLNGNEVLSRNAPANLSWNSQALAENPNEAATTFLNFNLNAHLDHLRAGANVLAIQGLNRTASDSDFLISARLSAFQREGQARRYFSNPTPGTQNDVEGLEGFVADTKFSVNRGVHSSAFDLELSTETEGAVIRYTTNRSRPTATSGNIYTDPIRIDSSTIIRAAAFKENFGSTDVDTHSYIFIDDVLDQSVMLRDVVRHPVYGLLLPEALTAVPTVSLVTEVPIVSATEVQTSMEFFHPDGGLNSVQVEAGVKRVGGHSLGSYPKNNMRLYFRKRYGDSKLRYPVFEGTRFGESAVDTFDRLNLRGGAHDSVFYLGVNAQAPSNAQYLRNRWMSDMQFRMGHLSLHGRWVQVYINGTYWGHYQLLEWPSQHFMADYLGGDKVDYLSTNSGRQVGDSNLSAWNTILQSTNNYSQIENLIDVVNFADYLILNFYGGNDWDWRASQNWMGAGATDPSRSRFQFFSWDSDIIFRRTTDNNLDQPGPGNLFQSLKRHSNFRNLIADRAHQHLFNDGVLTPQKVEESYLERVEEIRTSLVGETARWRWGGVTWTRDNQWQGEIDRLTGDFFPRRTEITINQLRQNNLYPSLEAPRFNQHGGRVEQNFPLNITAPQGTIYFTEDGTDPRLPNGEVSPSAQMMGVANLDTYLEGDAEVRVFVPTDDSLGLDWIELTFNDSNWLGGIGGVGYERSSTFDEFINVDIEEQAYQVNASAYIRQVFNMDDPSDIQILSLLMKYDDGFVAYLNGHPIARDKDPVDLQWNSRATGSRADSDAVIFKAFDVSDSIQHLREGENILAIHSMNSSDRSGDMLLVSKLVGSREVNEGRVPMDEPAWVSARTQQGDEWSALNRALFYFDVPLRITEIMYHPRLTEDGVGRSDEDYEFIELQNVGESSIDLNGIQISGAVNFDFIQEGILDSIDPAQVIIVARNRDAFIERYPESRHFLIGTYSGKLANSGERIKLTGSLGQPILDFSYSDVAHPSTDGEGYSLTVIDVQDEIETWDDPSHWRPSQPIDGTPGTVDSGPDINGGLQLPGDLNQNSLVEIGDAVSLLLHLYRGQVLSLPCEGGSITEGGNRVLADINGDNEVDTADAISLLSYIFLEGSPPEKGILCFVVEDCEDACGN